jgi:membrane peptidoglycan carboxypeptidase
MIPSPKRFYHLYVETGRVTRSWEERVNRVVGRLHAANVIDDVAYAQALAEPLTFHHGSRGESADRGGDAPPAAAPSKSLWQRLFGK